VCLDLSHSPASVPGQPGHHALAATSGPVRSAGSKDGRSTWRRYGHFMAHREQLDLLGVVGSGHEDYRLEQTADGEVYKSPELTSGPSTSHPPEGRRNGS